ncbi:MAG: hypothetical protein U0166_14170 [Acidobacteriota bacterium]
MPTPVSDARDVTVLLPVWDEGDVVGEVAGEVLRLCGDRILEVLLVVSDRSDERTLRAVASSPRASRASRPSPRRVLPASATRCVRVWRRAAARGS